MTRKSRKFREYGINERDKASSSAPPSGDWILATGFWDDNGIWDDNALWID